MLRDCWHPLSKRVMWAALAMAGLTALAIASTAAAAEDAARAHEQPSVVDPAIAPPELTLDGFLDRLMMAESGGRDAARNSRSSAVGPFQFIRQTFLDIVSSHFAEETATLSPAGVLALREDRAFARRAAEAYSKDNAAYLAGQGLPASFTNLRLAHLVGPSGAARILRAPPQTSVGGLLSPGAMGANPFLTRMSAAQLIAKSARDISVEPTNAAGISAAGWPSASARQPLFDVKCSLKLPACRRWVALRSAQIDHKQPTRKGRKALRSAQR
jgi:hypothetical protein